MSRRDEYGLQISEQKIGEHLDIDAERMGGLRHDEPGQTRRVEEGAGALRRRWDSTNTTRCS